ncbi:unnamed protein product, partial [Ceratitis capitata]
MEDFIIRSARPGSHNCPPCSSFRKWTKSIFHSEQYTRVPGYYTWNQSSKTFQRRKQDTAVGCDGFPG